MPRGPQGQKRELMGEEDRRSIGNIRSGKAGAKARVEKLSGDETLVIARRAAAGRWHR
jgi:hypothetical protein